MVGIPGSPYARSIAEPVPQRLLDVMVEHRLGGVETMLLLHLFRRWPTHSLGGGAVMKLDGAAAALRVTTCVVDAAVDRLAARPLVEIELRRRRRRVVPFPLVNLIGGMRHRVGEPGILVLETVALDRITGLASRGRHAPLLLVLLSLLAWPDPVARITVAGLATALRLAPRSVKRILACLVREGVIGRVAGGFDLSRLLDEEAPLRQMSRRSTRRWGRTATGRSVADVLEQLPRTGAMFGGWRIEERRSNR